MNPPQTNKYPPEHLAFGVPAFLFFFGGMALFFIGAIPLMNPNLPRAGAFLIVSAVAIHSQRFFGVVFMAAAIPIFLSQALGLLFSSITSSFPWIRPLGAIFAVVFFGWMIALLIKQIRFLRSRRAQASSPIC